MLTCGSYSDRCAYHVFQAQFTDAATQSIETQQKYPKSVPRFAVRGILWRTDGSKNFRLLHTSTYSCSCMFPLQRLNKVVSIDHAAVVWFLITLLSHTGIFWFLEGLYTCREILTKGSGVSVHAASLHSALGFVDL